MGNFAIPTPSKTSELANDARFMSVHEYKLDLTKLKTTPVTISDIKANSVVHQIDLLVDTAFVSSASQNNIEVLGADGTVLMDKTWNDPNTAGNYSTACNYTVTSTIKVSHDLTGATAGNALLRVFVHDPSN